MSWKNLAAPLIVVLAGVAIIAVLLAAPDGEYAAGARNQGAAAQDQDPCDSYPQPDYCDAGGTSPYPDPGDETEPVTTTVTVSATAPTARTPATTPTKAGTPATAPVAPQALTTTATPAEDGAEAETPGPQAEATPEGTPTPSDELTCTPGEAITIAGYGPPRAAILLYFDQRIVGGGSVAPSGSFAIPLLVGKERPGIYTVTVRIRGSSQVLRAVTCEVPAASPTQGEPL
jgi:hypothetical protein